MSLCVCIFLMCICLSLCVCICAIFCVRLRTRGSARIPSLGGADGWKAAQCRWRGGATNNTNPPTLVGSTSQRNQRLRTGGRREMLSCCVKVVTIKLTLFQVTITKNVKTNNKVSNYFSDNNDNVGPL